MGRPRATMPIDGEEKQLLELELKDNGIEIELAAPFGPHARPHEVWQLGDRVHGEMHLLGAVGYQARTSPFLSFWIFKAAGLSGATARITAPDSDRDSSLTAFSHSNAVDKPTK
jgi:hypothetical protein